MFRRMRSQNDFSDELKAHIDAEAQRLREEGLSDAEARSAARKSFGNVTRANETFYESRRSMWFEQLRQDLRFAFRTLRKSRGFTAIAILTLALGTGANTAIFTLVKATLLEHLPLRASSRLVVIWVSNLKAGWSRIGPSGRDYLDWKEQSQSFEDLFLFEHGTGTVTGSGEPEQVAGLRVSTNFGEFFGIQPALGRMFALEEGNSRHNLAVLSYRYWQQHYGGDATVIGRALTLNGEPYTIIGVLPATLSTVFPIDMAVPFDNDWIKRADSDLGVFGRLKPGVTLKRASAEMNLVVARTAEQRPSRRDYGAVMVPLETARVEFIRPAVLVLLCGAGFVLLIACANVANLLLSRAVGRQREIALRMALGAGRFRLVRQFVAESTLLSLMGGAAGLLLAIWSSYLIARFVPSRIPVPNAADHVMLPSVRVDGVAFAFTVGIALLTGIAFGLAPALQSLKCDVIEALKSGQKGAPSGRHDHRMRALLVIAESALAFVMVIGAGLMLKSFASLLAANPGFRMDHLLTLRLKLAADVKGSKYNDLRQRASAYEMFLSRIRALPGVQSAAIAEIVPLSQDDMDMNYFVIKGQAPPAPGEHLSADNRDVSTDYFRTMGIPIERGRAFSERDTGDAPRVVMIDETLARIFFRDKDPIGQHLQIPDGGRPEREIVGVVGGVHDTGFSTEPRPTIYFPLMQSPDQTVSVVVRTSELAQTILPAIKSAIYSVDPEQPVFNVRTMDDIVADITSAQRVAFFALGVFAFLALSLAAIGIYGVTAYAVGQRTQEIGTRMALGAQPRDVLRLIVGQGLKLTIWGLAAGVLAALALTRSLSGLLYGVSASDPATFVGVAMVLVCVAAGASFMPAWRAARVDPVVALRQE